MSIKLTLFQVNRIKQWASYNPEEYAAIRMAVDNDRFITSGNRTRETYERAYKRMCEQERAQSKTLTPSETLELKRLLGKLRHSMTFSDTEVLCGKEIDVVESLVSSLIESGE